MRTTLLAAAAALGLTTVRTQAADYTYVPTAEDQQAIATCVGDHPSIPVVRDCVLQQAHQIASAGHGLTSWSSHPQQFEVMIRTAMGECGINSPSGGEPTATEKQCLAPELIKITDAIADALADYAAAAL
jgi:hypothetical protein